MMNCAPNLTTAIYVVAAFQSANAGQNLTGSAWVPARPAVADGSQSPNIFDSLKHVQQASLRPLLEALEKYSELKDGWEGEGTVAPLSSAIDDAREFLGSFSPRLVLPEISVGSDGEVNMSWRDEHKFIDISFYDASGGMMYARIGQKIYKIPSGIRNVSHLPQAAIYNLIDA